MTVNEIAEDAVNTDTSSADSSSVTETKTEATTEKPDPEKGYWPSDWRTKAAAAEADEKERTKFLKRLERFQSPEDALKALREQDIKLSSGKFIDNLPEKHTPEQLAEWRKKNGIPEDVKGYDLTLGKGRIIGDEDRPMVEKFVEKMHQSNANPTQVKQALEAYYDLREEDSRALAEFDAEAAKSNEDALRSEWGGEYRVNTNINENLLATLPDALRNNMLGGRMADGSLIKDNADFKRMINTFAREINPVGVITPANGQNAVATIDSRMAEIENMMGTRKYEENDAIQAEYRSLIEAKEKYSKR